MSAADLTEMVVRHWAIERLEAWLGDEQSRIFLVTGPPGTGKTSLAAQLVLLQHEVDAPRLRAADVALAHFCDSSNERTLDALDFVSALSHALAERIPGFADALAGSASGASAVVTITSTQTVQVAHPGASITGVHINLPRDVPTRQAFAHLVRRPLEAVVAGGWDRQILVIVDDLSGGYRYDSEDNIARLIGLVADNPAELPEFLRFVVTSRPDPWVLRDLPPPALDLLDDQPDHEDIRRYVDGRLTTLDEPNRQAWTDHVAWAADGNFLYARYALDALLSDPDVLALGPANHELPAGLTELYRTWLVNTVARNRTQWWESHQPVLTALTVARGAGLTVPQLAGITELPRTKVRRALEECQQFLLGDTAGPVRLYHDSFREFLAADDVSEEEGHRAVVGFFLRTNETTWLQADQYARDHLATHAARTGDLATLLHRLDFLVIAEPTAVLHELSQVDNDRHTEVYQRASWLLADRSPGERASYLALAALEIGATDLAESFSRLPVEAGWSPRWVSLARHRPGRIVGTHPSGVVDMLPVTLNGGTMIVTVGIDGSLRLWDLRTHTLRSSVKLPDPCPSASITIVDGWLVVASPRALWLIDPVAEDIAHTLPTRAESLVTAATDTQIGEDELLAVGYADGVIEVVDQSGARIAFTAHDGPVLSLSSAFRNAILSGGADGKVIMWSLVENTRYEGELLRAVAEQELWTSASAFLPGDNGGWALVVGFSDGIADLTRSTGGEEQTVSLELHEPAAGLCGWHAIAADGTFSRTTETNAGVNSYAELQKRHQEEQESNREDWTDEDDSDGPPLPEEVVRVSGGVNSVALEFNSDTVYLATAGEDGHVEVTTARGGDVASNQFVPDAKPISAVRFAHMDGRLMLLAAESAGSGAIREWPIGQEDSPFPPVVGELDIPIAHFATATDESGRHLLATAYDDDSVVLCEVDGNRIIGDPLESGLVLRGVHMAGNLLVAYGYANMRGAIRVWELDSFAAQDVRFDQLSRVQAVASVGADLLVAGTPVEADAPPLWLLSPGPSGWSSAPVELRAKGPIPTDVRHPTWLVAAPGTEQVAVGEFGGPSLVSLSALTNESMWLMGADGLAATTYEGRPTFLVASGSFVESQPVIRFGIHPELKFLGAPGHLTEVAAHRNAELVVAATDNDQLVIWRTTEEPDQVIQLSSTIRQLAVSGDDTVLVRTDLGMHAFLISRPA